MDEAKLRTIVQPQKFLDEIMETSLQTRRAIVSASAMSTSIVYPCFLPTQDWEEVITARYRRIFRAPAGTVAPGSPSWSCVGTPIVWQPCR
jgi:hypothetical protein